MVTDDRRLAGTGTLLVEAVVDATAAAGARRLWLVTMNDNVDTLGFHRRRERLLAAITYRSYARVVCRLVLGRRGRSTESVGE